MQSVGQTGTQSSQPLQSTAMTVCISLRAPAMASTGQTCTHLKQPMQSASLIHATSGSSGMRPRAGSIGWAGRLSRAESACKVSAPPGGHWLMSAAASASAVA